jgi:hypothetical protein
MDWKMFLEDDAASAVEMRLSTASGSSLPAF